MPLANTEILGKTDNSIKGTAARLSEVRSCRQFHFKRDNVRGAAARLSKWITEYSFKSDTSIKGAAARLSKTQSCRQFCFESDKSIRVGARLLDCESVELTST